MRPRVLVLVPLLGALLGSLLSALVIRPQPPCAETAICVVDVRRGGGCLPGPCDVPRGLPVELWVGIASGLLLGLLVAVVFERRGTGWCHPLAEGGSHRRPCLSSSRSTTVPASSERYWPGSVTARTRSLNASPSVSGARSGLW